MSTIIGDPPKYEKKCELCDKEHYYSSEKGNNVGNGGKLGENIMGSINKSNAELKTQKEKKNRQTHKWFTFPGSLEAHHLICSESMNNEDWAFLCANYNYDINRKENGVMLPAYPALACHLGVPLHNTGHSATVTDVKGAQGEPLNYVNAVIQKIDAIMEHACNGKYCPEGESFTDDLDTISKDVILPNVSSFTWTITYDGKDYQKPNPIGCGGVETMPEKFKKYTENKVEKRRRISGNCNEEIPRTHKDILDSYGIQPNTASPALIIGT